MKKTFILAALVCVAAIFASCEKKEPTALKPENLNGNVTVAGYLRKLTYDRESSTELKARELEVVANQKIDVLYGTEVGGNMTYVKYEVTTNEKGLFSIDLPCALGQQIDEVKLMLDLFIPNGTYAGYTEGSEIHIEQTDAYFHAEQSFKPAAEGTTQFADKLTLEPDVLLGKPGMEITPYLP